MHLESRHGRVTAIKLGDAEHAAKESVLQLILGGEAVYRCDSCIVLHAASQTAEKLALRIRVSL
jgi:hypothetical protein